MHFSPRAFLPHLRALEARAPSLNGPLPARVLSSLFHFRLFPFTKASSASAAVPGGALYDDGKGNVPGAGISTDMKKRLKDEYQPPSSPTCSSTSSSLC